MKSNFIIDLIAGYFKKTPKRLAIARNVLIVLSAIAAAVMALNGHLFTAPDWVVTVCSPTGILSMLAVAFGFQAATKDGTDTTQGYPQLTETERLAINTSIAGAGYVCYQTDTIKFPVGYYQINTSLTWDYAGSRPPHR